LRSSGLLVVLCGTVTVLMFGGFEAQDREHEQYVSPWRTPWTYKDAAHWSDLDPQYAVCNTGKQQSPINIQNAQAAKLPPLRFQSKTAPVRTVINNRYTIRVNYRPGNGNFLLAGDRRYELTQFHFHHPSEEYIDGKSRPMEVHLMYQAGDGSVAGVTVLVQPGSANSTVRKIWEHMPKAEGQEQVAGVEISPAGLLPPEQVRDYYTYMGSVTAPPCTEGVLWFVLKRPLQMSAQQIHQFAQLFPDDARPLQPLNGRVVKQTW
jgi:carbonic anhydrase